VGSLFLSIEAVELLPLSCFSGTWANSELDCKIQDYAQFVYQVLPANMIGHELKAACFSPNRALPGVSPEIRDEVL
jgi:hypothetical protein